MQANDKVLYRTRTYSVIRVNDDNSIDASQSGYDIQNFRQDEVTLVEKSAPIIEAVKSDLDGSRQKELDQEAIAEPIPEEPKPNDDAEEVPDLEEQSDSETTEEESKTTKSKGKKTA